VGADWDESDTRDDKVILGPFLAVCEARVWEFTPVTSVVLRRVDTAFTAIGVVDSE